MDNSIKPMRSASQTVRSNWRLVLQIAVPIVCLAALSRLFDWSKVVITFTNANASLLWLALGLYGVTPLIFLMRWRSILTRFQIHYPISELAPVYCTGYALQFFLPTGLGDALKIVYLIEDGHPTQESTLSIVVDKLASYLASFVLGAVGLFLLPIGNLVIWSELGMHPSVVAIAVAVIALAGLILLTARPRYAQSFTRWPPLQPLLRWADKIFGRFSRLLNSASDKMRQVPTQAYLWFIALSLAGGWAESSVYYLIARALGIDLSYWEVVGIGSILAVLLSLPFITISVGGLGIRDGIVAGLFLLIGLPIEQAITFSLLIFFIAASWRVLALVGWIIRPINLGKINLGTAIGRAQS